MPTPPLSLDEVRALARLLHEADLSEIEIETLAPDSEEEQPEPPVRLHMRRGTEPTVVRRVSSAPTAPRLAGASTSAAATSPTPAAASGVPDAEPGVHEVLSPTVGVFLAARPAIQAGDVVAAGQKAGAVESLKIPTDIFFAQAGRVVAVLAEDNRGVEYGQPLFQVRSDGAA